MTLNRFFALMIPSLVFILVSQLIQLHKLTQPVPRTKTGQINMGGPKLVQIETEDLRFWVSEFETVARANGVDLTIDSLIVRYREDSFFAVTDTPQGKRYELANCQLAFGSAPVISVKKSYFEKISEWHKREIMFHELGHCILGLDHDERLEHGRVASIMYPESQGETIYNAMTASHYDTQLFKSTNKIRALMGTK